MISKMVRVTCEVGSVVPGSKHQPEGKSEGEPLPQSTEVAQFEGAN